MLIYRYLILMIRFSFSKIKNIHVALKTSNLKMQKIVGALSGKNLENDSFPQRILFS